MTRQPWVIITRRELVALVMWGFAWHAHGLGFGPTWDSLTRLLALAATFWLVAVLGRARKRPTWTVIERKDLLP